jgi:hypothetical protein
MRRVLTAIRTLNPLVPVLLGIALLLGSSAPALAQGFTPPGAPPWVFADNYGRWVFPGQNTSTYTFDAALINGCNVTQLNFADKPFFYAFANSVALAPVFIHDNNAALSEVITPTTYLVPTQRVCGANLSAVNQHTTFWLQSGTAGLQESINSVAPFTSLIPYEIILSPEWYKLVSQISGSNATLAAITPATIIAAAKGDKASLLVDITTNPPTYYVWTGAGGFVSGTQYWTGTPPPAVAAGTGAGTAPTIALAAGSNAVTGTVTLTTGTTPTASATIFTLTWSATPGTATARTNDWTYTPTCTVTSVGTVPYTGTNAVAGTAPSVDTYTATATALSASTPGYAWNYLCH